MGLNKNDLICIFMNINEKVKNKNRGKNCSHFKVLDGYEIYLASLGPILMAASVLP